MRCGPSSDSRQRRPIRLSAPDDPASLRAEIESLKTNRDQQELRLRYLEKLLDTRATPLWRRVLFRLDGYGPWWQVRYPPRWRPWRKWWRS